MEHSFDIDHAKKFGIEEAIFIKNFQYWLNKNRANEKNQHDGKTWTYNSRSAFCRLFPYMTEKQIRGTLDSLVDNKVLVKGNYNKRPGDRTLWYAFTDESVFLMEFQPELAEKNHDNDNPWGQEPFAQKGQVSAQKGQALPDSKHQIEGNSLSSEVSGQQSMAGLFETMGNILVPGVNGEAQAINDLPKKTAKFKLKKPWPEDGYEYRIAKQIYIEHVKHDPGFLPDEKRREASLQLWASDLDKLMRIDGRHRNEIYKVIRWTQEPGNFWAANILSGSKLREKYATLFAQMNRAKGHATAPIGGDQSDAFAYAMKVQAEIDAAGRKS